MKKLLIVFCLVTTLTLLSACNGVPALAATDDINNDMTTPAAIENTTEEGTINNVLTPAAIEQATGESGANTNTSKPEKAKKKEAKKAKKSTKTFNVMKYVKKGVFDWKAYGKAIGAKEVDVFGTNINMLLSKYCYITITSDLVRTKKIDGKSYLFIIYNLDVEYDEPEATFFFESKDWGKKIATEDGGSVSSVALEKAYDIAKYLKKHPDLHKKPKIKDIKWINGSEISKYEEE